MKTLNELQEELFWLRMECNFARGTMPIEEWREYHPRIVTLREKIEKVRQLPEAIDSTE